MAKSLIPLSVRFWAKVQKTDGCRLWLGAVNTGGYGMIYIGVHAQKRRSNCAPRVAWELMCGPIPDGLCVLHDCDNPRCVRPDHLFLGTHQDNVRDKTAKGRQSRARKLTEADVSAIRSCYAIGGITQRALAKQYGVCQQTVCDIIRRKRWRTSNARSSI